MRQLFRATDVGVCGETQDTSQHVSTALSVRALYRKKLYTGGVRDAGDAGDPGAGVARGSKQQLRLDDENKMGSSGGHNEVVKRLTYLY